YTGSGPFIFKRDEWKPGERAVYIKNPNYKPRPEKSSWTSGGKVVNVDRVEWVAIPDAQTAVNALIAGEIDMVEDPSLDGTPVLLMHSTDLQVLANLAPVAKSLLERGGFKVNMVDMDWQSVVARRAKKVPVSEGGWNAFLTAWAAADILNPVSAAFLAANCDAAA